MQRAFRFVISCRLPAGSRRLVASSPRLQATAEGEHDLLRNTAVLYGSGMSWPATHRAHNLPLLLAGGEGLGFAQGQHIAFNGQQKHVSNDQRSHLATDS